MKLIAKEEIENLINESQLIVTPLLSKNQIGQSSIDLRLGNIFKVSKLVREGFIDINKKNLEKFFETSVRDFGEEFMLYPNQLVLATTFEFLKIPNNIVGNIYTRSSLNRLGIQIASMVHSGYRGSLTLELINKGITPIKLKVGMRIIQLSLFKGENFEYKDYSKLKEAKYIANIEPKISIIYEDTDLQILSNFMK